MESIAEISDNMECLIDKAEHFAKCAVSKKESDNSLAEAYYRIANDLLAHVSLLHTQIVAKIEGYKQTGAEIPKDMQRLYDILHKKHIEHVATIKGMLALYKEM